MGIAGNACRRTRIRPSGIFSRWEKEGAISMRVVMRPDSANFYLSLIHI
ncbi:hypothetical protein [Xanthomonas vasicola]|nr:hypothetical protein [Xanthomonas vasicola]HHZ52798.1 hypothetical protein [Xanthomonas vasicola pv. zeae]